MKKIISLVLALVMAFSLCGCNMSDYKKAQNAYENGDYENASTMFETLGDYKESQAFYNKSQAAIYDEKIKAFVNDWTGNISDAEALYTDYKNLSDEIKAEMSYCEDFERTFPVYLVDYVSTLKNDNIEEIKRIIREYSECMDEDQLATCMIYFGQWDAVEKAEDFLKERLKNPHSYHRYSGKVSTPEEHRDFAYCTMYVMLEYGATNSYGGEVESTEIVYICFSYDTDKRNITYNYIGADEDSRNKSVPDYYFSRYGYRSMSVFTQNLSENFSNLKGSNTSTGYNMKMPTESDFSEVGGQWVAKIQSDSLNCDFYAIASQYRNDDNLYITSIELVFPTDEIDDSNKKACAIDLMTAVMCTLDRNTSITEASAAAKELFDMDDNSNNPTSETQKISLSETDWRINADEYIVTFRGKVSGFFSLSSNDDDQYALAAAISTLNAADISKDELLELLQNAGFSDSEIEYAMENCGGKWNTDSN